MAPGLWGGGDRNTSDPTEHTRERCVTDASCLLLGLVQFYSLDTNEEETLEVPWSVLWHTCMFAVVVVRKICSPFRRSTTKSAKNPQKSFSHLGAVVSSAEPSTEWVVERGG